MKKKEKKDLLFLLNEKVEKTIDIETIKNAIPHREPFLFIDSLDIIEKDKYAVGHKLMTGEEDFFKGHFPGMPIMPGVLILEALAQTTAATLMDREGSRGKAGFFITMDEVKFKNMVKPKDNLKLAIEILRVGKIAKCFAQSYVEEKLCAQGYLSFFLGDKIAEKK